MKGPDEAGNAKGDINEFMTLLDGKMDEIVTHKRVGQVTEEAFAAVDVAGYNYMAARCRGVFINIMKESGLISGMIIDCKGTNFG